MIGGFFLISLSSVDDEAINKLGVDFPDSIYWDLKFSGICCGRIGISFGLLSKDENGRIFLDSDPEAIVFLASESCRSVRLLFWRNLFLEIADPDLF